ncbi:unnamed protein product [Rotaria socialis]|uniref:F-box domain-containing protein n=1 Tax=Rotaria socialis TaxID=392032 RepID=A0A821I6Y4_9BILA|nr:unnamed protein product [Rotaria socialis]CAF3449111.1 unnamed protein product [Rotaria socialis]CAF4206810.1 unnamed protein product [Rotaria socialis]CAF4696510.1 unnamed protein product [Rotaria socialis]
MFKRLFKKKPKKGDASIAPSSARRIDPPHVKWTHSWSTTVISNALAASPFNCIPNEILLSIFQLMSVPDLCNVSLVCRLFKMTFGN